MQNIVKLYLIERRTSISPTTYQSEQYRLRRFANYFSIVPLDKATLIEYLYGMTCSDISKLSSWRTVRPFIRWAVKNGYLVNDFTQGLKLRFAPPDPRLPLSRDEVERILKTIPRKQFDQRRDYALFSTVFYCGLRISEALGLTADKVDLETQTVIVIGKRSKIRSVPIPKPLVSVLSGWMGHVRGRYLFPRYKNVDAPVHRHHATHRWQGYVKASGVSKRCRIHDLRHAYASYLYENDTDLGTIQALLGHSHIQTTQIYAHMSPHKLRKDVNRVFNI